MNPVLLDLKTVAEIAQNAAVALAVVVGGGWTLYTFFRLGLVAKAEAELEEKMKALHESAVLDVTISAEQLSIKGDDAFYISSVASIVNVGNVDTFINYDEARFFITEVNYDKEGMIVYGTPVPATYPSPLGNKMTGTTMPSKFTCRIPYLFRVKHPGLFLVSFEAVDHGEANNAINKLCSQTPGPVEVMCTANLFVAVNPTPA